jgi:RNA 2',3'-cyclic 3'-phosphodiesterase
MAKPELLRTFIALPLSANVIEQLDRVQRMVRRTSPEQAVTWVKPSSIHLTLFFLGEILPEMTTPVQEALHVIARNTASFSFTVQGIGAFPTLNRPRVIWVGLADPGGRLAVLHQAVNEALETIGFQPETRPFSPHLTLGRVKPHATREDVQAIGQAVGKTEVGLLGQVRVAEIIFFRSTLKPTGAEYTPLKTFPLT